MKDSSLVNQCLEFLKRDEFIKLLLKPVIEFILFEIQPYTYIIIFLLFMIFATTLANLIILLRFTSQK